MVFFHLIETIEKQQEPVVVYETPCDVFRYAVGPSEFLLQPRKEPWCRFRPTRKIKDDGNRRFGIPLRLGNKVLGQAEQTNHLASAGSP